MDEPVIIPPDTNINPPPTPFTPPKPSEALAKDGEGGPEPVAPPTPLTPMEPSEAPLSGAKDGDTFVIKPDSSEKKSSPPKASGGLKKVLPVGALIIFLLAAAIGSVLVYQRVITQQKATEICIKADGSLGQSCASLNNCDIAGGCNPACCASDNDCPSSQKCDIPNNYCQSKKSCNSGSSTTTPPPIPQNCAPYIDTPGSYTSGACSNAQTASVRVKFCVPGGCPATTYTYQKTVASCSGGANCAGACGASPSSGTVSIPAGGCATVNASCSTQCGNNCQVDIDDYGARSYLICDTTTTIPPPPPAGKKGCGELCGANADGAECVQGLKCHVPGGLFFNICEKECGDSFVGTEGDCTCSTTTPPTTTTPPGTTRTPTSPPPTTPPPSSGTCGCVVIKLFNAANQEILPSGLVAGQVIKIGLMGSGTNQWRGRIRVTKAGGANLIPAAGCKTGALIAGWCETEQYSTALGYYVSYTVPAELGTYSVEGEINCSGSWR